ncbi:glycosyltransferase [Kitasatospora sp. NPDC101155]|uniref:glycosyltransferase n=1 Tax=Kitasatospora sp. NPDC101155 TaxID=3364097 RepID=UPI00381872D3
MNICFLTKYPPIQGGVSMHCYWAARGLAERGHRVFVVTNADEVEETFRIRIPETDRVGSGAYAPEFPESGGRVIVTSTQPPDRRELYYVPLGNPTVSRLAGLATELIRAHDCEVIFSYYLEPYGVAAHLASRFTGVPYVFKHAGSDLHRLMQVPELRTTYTEVLRGANRLISRGPSRTRLLEAGVDESAITSCAAFGLPADLFTPVGPSRPLSQWIATGSEPARPVDSGLPILGVYGKLGEFKGSFDLLHAMRRLFSDGFRFNLAAAVQGWQQDAFTRLAGRLGLADHVHLIPFMPHWSIPEFIRSCTAVAFLERDFPIAAHTPTIPSEIIACGGCLVVSTEVARKQLFRAAIRDRRNVVVTDPLRHDELAAALRYALEDGARAQDIGRRGHVELGYEPTYESYVGELEQLLISVAAEPTGSSSPSRRPDTAGADPTGVAQAVPGLYPRTQALLTADDERRLHRAAQADGSHRDAADRRALALRVGRLLLGILPPHAVVAREVCRYEYKIHEWTRDATRDKPTAPPGAELDWRARPDRARPRLVGQAEIVEFSCDVEPVLEALAAGRQAPAGEGPLKVLFHEATAPLRVSEPTAWVVELLRTGDLTVDQIADLARERYDATGPHSDRTSAAQCLDVLEGLCWEGVVTFD